MKNKLLSKILLCILLVTGTQGACHLSKAISSQLFSKIKIEDFKDKKVFLGNTYVEIHEFASKINAGVIHNSKADEYTIQIYDENTKLTFAPQNKHVVFNDNQAEMMLSPVKVGDTLYLPYNEVARVLGYGYKKKGDDYKNVSDVDLGDGNEVVIRTKEKLDYTVSLVGKKKLVIVVKKAFLTGAERIIKVGNRYIKDIIVRRNLNEKTVKVEINCNSYRKHKSYYDAKKKAIVVEIYGMFKLTLGKKKKYKKISKEIIYLDKGKQIVKGPKEEVVKKIEEEKKEFKKLNTSGRNKKVSLGKIELPDLSQEEEIKFSLVGKKITLKKWQYSIGENNILLVPLKTIVTSLGYSIYFNSKTKEVDLTREDGMRMRLKVGFRKVGIAGSEKKRVDGMRLPLIIQSGRIVAPLEDIIRVLREGLLYGAKDKTIYIGHRVNEVSYEVKGGIEQVGIYCTGKIEPTKIFSLENPTRLFINLKNAVLDVPNYEVKVNRGNIIRLRMAQNENNLVRVVVDLKEKVSHGVVIDPDQKKSMIQFVPYINKVTLLSSGVDSKVYLRATRPLKYNIKKMTLPHRFEINFPDAVFKASNLVKKDQGIVERVRSSQVLWNPLTARVVLDLVDEGELEDILSKDKMLLTLKIKPKIMPDKRKIIKAKKISSYLVGKKICINAGHGGSDPGAISIRGIMEKDLTLKTALKLQRILSESGAIVMMPREGDETLSLDERVDYVNRNKPDLLVSIHYNAHDRRSLSGTETYYCKSKDLPLAKAVHSFLISRLKRRNGGIRKAKMYILNHTNVPGVLLEPAYISNKSEERLVCDSKFQDKLVKAVVDGIKKFFKK